MRPVYRLKNCRERLARYSNHLTFLTKCRTHGIIPQGLRVTLPVRSTQADNIAERTGQALVRERIGEAHRQREMLTGRITRLEADLSRTLNADEWPRIDQLCKNAADRVYNDTKRRQIRKFSNLKSEGTPSRPTLETSKLVVNLSHRQLTPLEEEVLALGLSFAIAPRSIPFEDIIAATEATAHRLDQNTADSLRTDMAEVLRKAKPPKPNMSFKQRSAVRTLRNDSNIVIVPADKGKATVVMDKNGLRHQDEGNSPR